MEGYNASISTGSLFATYIRKVSAVRSTVSSTARPTVGFDERRCVVKGGEVVATRFVNYYIVQYLDVSTAHALLLKMPCIPAHYNHAADTPQTRM